MTDVNPTPQDWTGGQPRTSPLGPPAAPVPPQTSPFAGGRPQPWAVRPTDPGQPEFGYRMPQYAVRPPDHRRTVMLVLGAAVVVVALLVGGTIGYLALRSTTVTVEGSLQLKETDDQSCRGLYGDIQTGVQLTVTDPTGAIIGVTSLGVATAIPGATGTVCKFPFTVEVPTGKATYGITVQRHGTLQFSEAEMRAGPRLTLN